MPTYEYACDLCGHKMEIFQSIMADRLVNCPSCSGDGLKRLIGTGGGIIFKGTGFYQTDYKNAPRPAGDSSKGSDKSEASPATGDNKSTSSKPADSGAKPAPAGSGNSSS